MIAVLARPALTLAGLPGTSGWVAKDALTSALAGSPGGWQIWLGPALFVSNFGTSLLMLRAGRLLATADPRRETPRDVVLPWLAMTGLVVAGLWLMPAPPGAPKAVGWIDLEPLAAAVLLAGLCSVLVRAAGLRVAPMPPGEILALLTRAHRARPVLALPPPPRHRHTLIVRRRTRLVARSERGALAILTVAAGPAVLIVVTTPDAPPEPNARVEES